MELIIAFRSLYFLFTIPFSSDFLSLPCIHCMQHIQSYFLKSNLDKKKTEKQPIGMVLVGSVTGFFCDSDVGFISSTVVFWLQLSKGQFAVGLSCPFRWHLIFSYIKMFCLLHGVLQMPYDTHPQRLLW